MWLQKQNIKSDVSLLKEFKNNWEVQQLQTIHINTFPKNLLGLQIYTVLYKRK